MVYLPPSKIIRCGHLIKQKAVGDDLMEDKLLSVREAAAELGCTPSKVLKLIRQSKLTASKVGWVWTIRRSDLEAYKSGE